MADYYNELGLNRSATEVDVKKAYRKFAIRYHPEKDGSEEAARKFASVAEAFDVLSDAKKKGFYDLYGEEALKVGIPNGKGEKKGGFYSFEQTPMQVFDAFFGTANPYAALVDISHSFENMTKDAPKKTGKPSVYNVDVSLEDLHYGCEKKIAHQRKVTGANGATEVQERTLTVAVAPGAPSGQRYVFDGEGNQKANQEPGPAVAVLQVLPHDRFERKGADLVFTARLPLAKALSGTVIPVQTLDGRTLNIPVTTIVQQGDIKVIAGEGLPTGDADGAKGDLIVVFDLVFPGKLSQAQKTLLSAAFFLPPTQTAEQAKAVKDFSAAFQDPLKGWSAGYQK